MNRPIKNRLKSLEYSSIKPLGWLRDQLELQMNGITGRLDEYWGSVGKYSDWIGGTDNSWERPPYWLDGLVPLSFLLGDRSGIAKAEKWLSWSMDSQRDNGDFGPMYRTFEFDESLFWPKFVMMKAFISFYEAAHDNRVIPFMTNYFRFCLTQLDRFKMNGWAEARGGDLAYAVLWLYDKTNEDFLIKLLGKINNQTLDWADMFENFPFTRPTCYYYKWDKIISDSTRDSLYSIMQYHYTHIVNVAMGIKQPLMKYRETGEKRYLDAIYSGLSSLYKYHGQVAGVFGGDEHLNGINPTQGTELCSVVEYMFSLQLLLEATGDPMFADLIERAAYNALPATISEDFKAHQYDQQANQVLVSKAYRNWYNNGNEANIFGFEPNFGCCLANMHQGWPKFTKNAFMTGEGEIFAAVYMPIQGDFETESGRVSIIEDTEYPFKGRVEFHFIMDKPQTLKFNMRIPGWCSKYKVIVNGTDEDYEVNGKWAVINRTFNDNDRIQIIFEMPVMVKHGWYNNSISVERGPLVFGLDIKESWRELKKGIDEYKYYEIYPESPWNYGLDLSKDMTAQESNISTKQAFSHSNSPVKIRAKAFKIPEWKLKDNSAGDVPLSPIQNNTELMDVTLIPYGAAKLRISLFPWSNDNKSSPDN